MKRNHDHLHQTVPDRWPMKNKQIKIERKGEGGTKTTTDENNGTWPKCRLNAVLKPLNGTYTHTPGTKRIFLANFKCNYLPSAAASAGSMAAPAKPINVPINITHPHIGVGCFAWSLQQSIDRNPAFINPKHINIRPRSDIFLSLIMA